MPAPEGLGSQFIARMPPQVTHHPYFISFINALGNEITKKWTAWIPTAKWGGLIVEGKGIPNWLGKGDGGKLTADSYNIDAEAIIASTTWAGHRTPATLKLLHALDTVLNRKFKTWVDSYVFANAPYKGDTSATYEYDGTFDAKIVETNLFSLGHGTNPSGIQGEWEAILTSAPIPIFRIDHPLCRVRNLTNAVSSVVEEQFVQFFLVNTVGLKNTVTGPSRFSTGQGVATSKNDGIIK